MTMTLIETITVGSGGAASIEFTGIAGDATDLVLLLSLRNSVDSPSATLAFNTGGSYTRKRLLGNGSAASSDSATVDLQSNTSVSTASTFSNSSVYVSNYASAVAKSYSVDSVNENNATLANQAIIAGSWTGTAAITSLELTPTSGNFVEHSTASLYSIS